MAARKMAPRHKPHALGGGAATAPPRRRPHGRSWSDPWHLLSVRLRPEPRPPPCGPAGLSRCCSALTNGERLMTRALPLCALASLLSLPPFSHVGKPATPHPLHPPSFVPSGTQLHAQPSRPPRWASRLYRSSVRPPAPFAHATHSLSLGLCKLIVAAGPCGLGCLLVRATWRPGGLGARGECGGGRSRSRQSA